MAKKSYSEEEQKNRTKEANAIGFGIFAGLAAGWVGFVARLRKHYTTFFDSITPDNIVGPLDDLISKQTSSTPSAIPIVNEYKNDIASTMARGNNLIKGIQWQGFQEQRYRSFLDEFSPLTSSSIPLPNRWKWITSQDKKNVIFVAATVAVTVGAICYGVSKFLNSKNEASKDSASEVSLTR